MTITKRGKKYGYDFRYQGERYRSHLWSNKRDAEDAEVEKKEQLRKGIDLSHGMTFSDYFEDWKDVKTKGLSLRTIENYQYSQLVLDRYFKKRKLKDIKRIEYQKFIKWLGLEAPNRKTGKKGMSKETVDKVHGHIKHAVQDAKYEGLIVKDFTYDVEKFYTDNAKPVDEKFITIDEFKKIKQLAKDDHTLTSIGIFISTFTGARYSDFKHMKYDDINIMKSEIHLPGTKNKNADRVLKISQKDLISLQKKIDQFPRNINGYIFHNGRSFIRGESFNERLNTLVEPYKMRRLTIYVLRHTIGSIFLSEGLSEDYVYKFLGHTSTEQLRKTYRHLLKETQDVEELKSMRISEKL
jgi:integrase